MEGIVPEEEDPQREHDWWSGGLREKQIISWLVMIHFLNLVLLQLITTLNSNNAVSTGLVHSRNLIYNI